MHDIIDRKLAKYLEDTLGLKANIREWDAINTLPHAIRRSYAFSEIRILSTWFIVFTIDAREEFSAATISKHLSWVENKTDQRAIFVTEALEAYNRKRLIEQKVSFIVPGNQLYIPDLGLDLREQLRRVREHRKTLSPSAQLLLLAHLVNDLDFENWTATGISKDLGVTKMTIGRAIDELISFELVDIEQDWRERRIIFNESKRNTWNTALPHFATPVTSRVYLEDDATIQDQLLGITRDAGFTSLAKHTMLMPPTPTVKAISRKNWKRLQENRNLRLVPKPSKEVAAVELEVWKYDPAVLSRSEDVDSLSLYLSLQHETDERVEQALEELMSTVTW